jgi:hypothetical protein
MAEPRSLAVSATLIAATIAGGLALRLVPIGLPLAVTKYGGSLLWAAMVYWIVTAVRPRWAPARAALVAGGIAFVVEAFQLVRWAPLDAFRQTLPGALLLGRVFAAADLVAYAVAIGLAWWLDRCLRR